MSKWLQLDPWQEAVGSLVGIDEEGFLTMRFYHQEHVVPLCLLDDKSRQVMLNAEPGERIAILALEPGNRWKGRVMEEE